MAEAVERTDDVDAPAREREPLADRTVAWLDALPEGMRPSALPARFPHIANLLARRWADPASLRGYLDEVLIDSRGNRQGLPEDVADELATLKNFVETVLYPVPQTVWDDLIGRSKRGR